FLEMHSPTTTRELDRDAVVVRGADQALSNRTARIRIPKSGTQLRLSASLTIGVVLQTDLAEPAPRAVVRQDALDSGQFIVWPVHLCDRVPDNRKFIAISRQRARQPAACRCLVDPHRTCCRDRQGRTEARV